MRLMRRTIALALLAALLSGCAGENGAVKGTNSSTRQAESLLPKDRLALPDFDPARYETLIGQLRGTPVVVNVWGSWCPPCIQEAPDLATVSKEFDGRVQFLGVDILDERQAARDFILQYDWPYPHLFDPTGAIRDALGYIGQPVTILYDRSGKLAFEWDGIINADRLRKEIRKVL